MFISAYLYRDGVPCINARPFDIVIVVEIGADVVVARAFANRACERFDSWKTRNARDTFYIHMIRYGDERPHSIVTLMELQMLIEMNRLGVHFAAHLAQIRTTGADRLFDCLCMRRRLMIGQIGDAVGNRAAFLAANQHLAADHVDAREQLQCCKSAAKKPIVKHLPTACDRTGNQTTFKCTHK